MTTNVIDTGGCSCTTTTARVDNALIFATINQYIYRDRRPLSHEQRYPSTTMAMKILSAAERIMNAVCYMMLRMKPACWDKGKVMGKH